MAPLPGSATSTSPAVMATAELGLANIAATLKMSAKSAASTTREQIRMANLQWVKTPRRWSSRECCLQRECQTSAPRLTIWKQRHAVRGTSARGPLRLDECHNATNHV